MAGGKTRFSKVEKSLIKQKISILISFFVNEMKCAFLTWWVEIVLASIPGQLGSERGKKVVDGPCDDHVVIQAHNTRGHEVGKSQAWKRQILLKQ